MPRKLTPLQRQQIILDRLKDREMDAPRFNDFMSEIGGEFDEKTVRRDIADLKKAGAMIRREGGGRNTVYVLDNDFELPGSFSARDMVSLTLLRETIKGYAGEFLERQLDELARKIGKVTIEQREYSREEVAAVVSFRPPPARPVDPLLWETVLTATLKRAELAFDYSGRRGHLHRVTARPYHMVSSEGEWYLLAGSPTSPVVSQYSFAQMSGVEIVPGRNHFAVPEDFDPHVILQNSFGAFISGNATTTVRVRITGFMVSYVRDRIFQPRQTITSLEGGKVLEISFPASASGPFPLGNVASWVLSMGPCAEVLEPPELIERVKEEARALLSLYDGGGPSQT